MGTSGAVLEARGRHRAPEPTSLDAPTVRLPRVAAPVPAVHAPVVVGTARRWWPAWVGGAVLVAAAGSVVAMTATAAPATLVSSDPPISSSTVPTPGGLALPAPTASPAGDVSTLPAATSGTPVPRDLVGKGAEAASDELRHAGFDDVLFLNRHDGNVIVPHDIFHVVAVPAAGTRVDPGAQLVVYTVENPPAPAPQGASSHAVTVPQDPRICATYWVTSLDESHGETLCDYEDEVRAARARGAFPGPGTAGG
jgi:hypothetical protein